MGFFPSINSVKQQLKSNTGANIYDVFRSSYLRSPTSELRVPTVKSEKQGLAAEAC